MVKLALEQVLEVEKCKRYLAQNPEKAVETALVLYRELLLTQNAYTKLYEKYTTEVAYPDLNLAQR